jgi:LysR family glycine cleavage system transcriptional activator
MSSIHSKTSTPFAAPSRRLPPLNMLRAFEAAARLESVTRAAQELNVTQSAVSHQIKALEAWLGVTLVQRQGRKLALTDLGAAYLPGLSDAFDRMAQATARLERLTRRHTLSVNSTSTLASQWLIPRLSAFCAQVPAVDVQLVTTASLTEFDPAAFDVSIRCFTPEELRETQTRPAWRGVTVGAFLPDQLTPVCSPAWFAAQAPGPQTPADLAGSTLLHSRSNPQAWPDWLEDAGVGGVQGQSGLVFDHIHLAVQGAIQGLGMGLGNPHFLTEELANSLLVMPFPKIVTDKKSYHWILSPQAVQRPEAVAFCEWLATA